MYIIVEKKNKSNISKVVDRVTRSKGITRVYYDCDSLKPDIDNPNVSVIKEPDLFNLLLSTDCSEYLYLVGTSKNKQSSALNYLSKN